MRVGETRIDDGVTQVWTGREWASHRQADHLRDEWRRLLATHRIDIPQLAAAARIIDGLLDASIFLASELADARNAASYYEQQATT